MLALFRNNQFTTAIPLALYVVLTHLSPLLGKLQPTVSDSPAGGVLYLAWFGWLEGQPVWSAWGAVALVFVQALSVNKLADEFRLLSDRTWLPGLFYALVAACLPGFLYLTPPLVAVTFIPLVLQRLFNAYNQPKATTLVFDAAFWTTVAALFYPPAILLLIAVFFGLGIMRAYTFRERVVSLTGIVTALFLAWLWYFWTDRGWDFWQIQFGGLLDFYRFSDFSSDLKTSLQWVLPALFLLVILLSYGTYMFRKLIQTQKCISVLYWFWLVAGLIFFLQPQSHPAHFILMAPATGIFLSLSFIALRNRSMADLLHLMMLGFVLFIQFSDWLMKAIKN